MRVDHSAALHASQVSVLSVDDALKEEMHRYSSVLQIDIQMVERAKGKISSFEQSSTGNVGCPSERVFFLIFFPNLLNLLQGKALT